jgi:hypothetical protein
MWLRHAAEVLGLRSWLVLLLLQGWYVCLQPAAAIAPVRVDKDTATLTLVQGTMKVFLQPKSF